MFELLFALLESVLLVLVLVLILVLVLVLILFAKFIFFSNFGSFPEIKQIILLTNSPIFLFVEKNSPMLLNKSICGFKYSNMPSVLSYKIASITNKHFYQIYLN